jgi:hypothetical protein
MRHKNEKNPSGGAEKLSSDDLGGLVVDALRIGGLIKNADVKRAIAIVTEKLDARKGMGDY